MSSSPGSKAGAPARDLSRLFTRVNVGLAIGGLVSLVSLRLLGGAALDLLTPVVLWSWLLGTPFVGGVAFVTSKRRGARRRAALNAVLLLVWFLAAVGALLLH